MKYIKYRPALQKTFFFERQDGTWFACSEPEAFLQERRMNHKVRLVGVSDGMIHFTMMNEKIKEVNELMAEIEKKFESGKIKQATYDSKVEKLNEMLLEASREARIAEYEKAKGHIERPADPNQVRNANLTAGQRDTLNRMIR